MKDYYYILSIDKKSDIEIIKKAYKKLVLQHHPDINNNSIDIFYDIQEAYEVLSDPIKRLKYDRNFKLRPKIITYDEFIKKNNIDLDIRLKIYVSLQDIYNGGTKRIKYMRYINDKTKQVKELLDVGPFQYFFDKNIEIFNQKGNILDNNTGDLLLFLNKNLQYENYYIEDSKLCYNIKYEEKQKKEGLNYKITTMDNKEIEVKIPSNFDGTKRYRIPNKGLLLEDNTRDYLYLCLNNQ